MRHKFEFLAEIIRGKIDILTVSERKINESFPLGQVKINGFNAPCRLDRNSNGEGIMIFIREDLPAKLIASQILPKEGLYVELELRSNSG